ncbi:MAG: hypothetical protein A1D16_19845 [Flavihumibacter sp. CACIAM 22H1]|nr:MAG: hypothetical protein A1D16_19845 [Flavihumibacter sp. CACIAM 22H1]
MRHSIQGTSLRAIGENPGKQPFFGFSMDTEKRDFQGKAFEVNTRFISERYNGFYGLKHL